MYVLLNLKDSAILPNTHGATSHEKPTRPNEPPLRARPTQGVSKAHVCTTHPFTHSPGCVYLFVPTLTSNPVESFGHYLRGVFVSFPKRTALYSSTHEEARCRRGWAAACRRSQRAMPPPGLSGRLSLNLTLDSSLPPPFLPASLQKTNGAGNSS